MESFGAVSIDPRGDWVVYERRRAFDRAPRYDLGYRSVWAVSDLYLMNIHQGDRPLRLLSPDERGGLLLGPWSPSGARLIVFRLLEDRLEAGIVTLSDRTVRWTGLTPDMPITGDFVGWLDDRRIAMTIRPDQTLPWILRHDGDSQAETTRQWALMAKGHEPSRTIIDTRDGVATTTNPLTALSVVLLDAETLETRTVADGLVRDVAVSPDGRRLAVVTAGEGVGSPGVGPIIQSEILERGLLAIVDTATGHAVRVVQDRDVGLNLLRWSPSSQSLLVWSRRPGSAWSSGALTRITAVGVAEDVNREDLDPFPVGRTLDGLTAVHADFVGEAPVLYARRPGSDRLDWYRLAGRSPPTVLTDRLEVVPGRLAAITDHSVLMFGDGALWETKGDGVERVSPEGLKVADAGMSDPMKPVRLRVNAPPFRDWAPGVRPDGGFFLAGLDDAASSHGTALSGSTRVVAASPSALITLTTDKGEQTLRISRGGETRTLDQLNGELAGRAFPKAMPIPHLDRVGRQTTSYLFMPPATQPKDVKGVIVVVYPGAVDDGVYQDPTTMMFGLNNELIAGGGYAVLSPAVPIDGSGSNSISGYVESVDLAVDAVLHDLPSLPADRFAILGHSYGGYTALAIATRSHRYRSYVSWAGASDLIGKWGEFTPVSRSRPEEGFTLVERMGWVEEGQGATKAPPWAATNRYIEMSPLLAADQITEPVMLISGDRDFVPLSQSESIFSALHRQGRQARLLTYWGEGHLMWSPANARDLYRQLFAWWDTTFAEPVASVSSDLPTHEPSPQSRR